MEEAKKEKEQKEKTKADGEDDESESDEEEEDDEEEEEEESDDSDDDNGGGKGSDISDDEGTEAAAAKKAKQKKDKKDKQDAKASSSSSSSSASAPQQTIDLFGLGTNSSSSSEEHFPPQGAEVLQNLYGKESGVLYESKLLQVGLKLGVENNNTCKFMFFYGNRGSNSLKNVVIEPPQAEGDAYQIKIRPEEALEVPPKKQIQHYFLFSCFKPFKGPLPFVLKFNYQNTPYSIRLLVPLTIANFFVPATLQPEQFTGAWQKFTNEVIGVRKTEKTLEVSAVQSLITSLLKMSIIAGVDKNTDNFVAAGTFHTATKTPQGTFVTMPAMLRIETKSGMNVIRITIHSGHQLVSEALMNAITNTLALKE